MIKNVLIRNKNWFCSFCIEKLKLHPDSQIVFYNIDEVKVLDKHKKGILCLTFDNMGSAHKVGIREMATQSLDDRSLSVGYPKFFSLLDQLELKATFFVEGWNAIHNPALVKEIVERGHDLGSHGWVHEVFHELDATDSERVIADSLAAFRAIGVEPEGFRAPGGKRGPYLLDLMRKYNISFDSSVNEVAEETEPSYLTGGIPNVPWLWELIDYYQYFMHPDGEQTPANYEKLLNDSLEKVATQGGMMTPIFHAFVSGVDDERFSAVERFLTRAKNDDRIVIMTAKEAAESIQ